MDRKNPVAPKIAGEAVVAGKKQATRHFATAVMLSLAAVAKAETGRIF